MFQKIRQSFLDFGSFDTPSTSSPSTPSLVSISPWSTETQSETHGYMQLQTQLLIWDPPPPPQKSCLRLSAEILLL